ncbi:Beta-1,4-endoglucanase [Coniochaeta hoffmannii]|uniref:Endoglucanase EG-II n=1 Tax=Coniochaeta hoffmannii TaxID=91930 RepID=A0AA38VJK7_9PEZI|nr:Beta-1,4-endoglucanase [Coniochaeta hoffmannii]
MPSVLLSLAVLAGAARAQQSVWGQCGGIGWSGATSCAAESCCYTQNAYYAQCTPGTGCSASGTTLVTATTTKITSRGTTSAATPTPTSGGGSGRTRFAGVNIAGFDFGCSTDGTCNTAKVYPPVKNMPPSYNNPDGAGQMNHFYKDDHMNIFRLPVGWQYLVNNNLGGTLDSTNLGYYDQLVQSCLSTGAYCILDIHNYARWNGAVIGQGGPTNDHFVIVWKQLATKYASQSRIWFGIMNEPHDIPSIATWAETVQAVVTAIRNAGAMSQFISLPGSDWQSAGAVISNGSAAALSTVKNPDGTTTNLIFDVHKYLDSDNSGTHTECVRNNIDDAFAPLAAWLRQNGRQAILTETGGGNTASCQTYLCQQIAYLNANSDVYLGYVGWSAGSFDNTYELVETPTESGSSWTDTSLVKSCLARSS